MEHKMKEFVADMAQLTLISVMHMHIPFWQYSKGEISHDQLIAELHTYVDKIGFLLRSNGKKGS